MNGVERIEFERFEHTFKHGWSLERDGMYYKNGELADAAIACLLQPLPDRRYSGISPELFWPSNWQVSFYQKIQDKKRAEQLVVAGSLIAAEIDRLEPSAVKQIADCKHPAVINLTPWTTARYSLIDLADNSILCIGAEVSAGSETGVNTAFVLWNPVVFGSRNSAQFAIDNRLTIDSFQTDLGTELISFTNRHVTVLRTNRYNG